MGNISSINIQNIQMCRVYSLGGIVLAVAT